MYIVNVLIWMLANNIS